MSNYSNPFSEKRNQGFALAPSPAELKQAYRLVAMDLKQQFLKMNPDQTLRITKLGKFTKRMIQTKSGLPELKKDEQICVYYRINFSPFRSLKTALNQELE